MNNKQIAERTRELNSLIRELGKAERELIKMQYGICKHDVIVKIYDYDHEDFEGQCLFCGLNVRHHEEVQSYLKRGSAILDVCDLMPDSLSPREKMDRVMSIYDEVTDENDTESVEEVIDLINERLEANQ